MKEISSPPVDLDHSDLKNDIKGVIIGKCRACGGETVIEADKQRIAQVIQKLAVLRTQKCGSKNPNDTWTLLEGYTWDLSHMEDH